MTQKWTRAPEEGRVNCGGCIRENQPLGCKKCGRCEECGCICRVCFVCSEVGRQVKHLPEEWCRICKKCKKEVEEGPPPKYETYIKLFKD